MTTLETSSRQVHPRAGTASLTGNAHRALLEAFPPREVPAWWAATTESFEQVNARLVPLTWSKSKKTREHRMRGVRRVLRWLETFDGQTWQDRWSASGSDALRRDWADRVADQVTAQTGVGRRTVRNEVQCGSFYLAVADVYQPGIEWLGTRQSNSLAAEVGRLRDPAAFAELKEAAGVLWGTRLWSKAVYQISLMVLGKGGGVRDITVGDCLQLRHVEVSVLRQAPTSRTLFYTLLHQLGGFPANAPSTLRSVTVHAGQASAEELVDRYHVRCRPVRDLFVDYLNERRPALDYNTFEDLSRTLVARFWADLEQHHPGIDSLHLTPAVAAAWKERIRSKTIRRRTPDGRLVESTVPRLNPSTLLATVRAFYLDLATWAADEPARWGAWVAPCPVKDTEVVFRKHSKRVKARTDQRTRERMPALPTVLRTAELRLGQAQQRLAAFREASLGGQFTVLGETFTKPKKSASALQPILALDERGKRRHLVLAENRAFWAWAAIEFFRHTGARIEEMLEISHHSLVQYTLPTTGEVVPLLQIAPSKTDEERLLLVSPELADVLSTMITRVRGTHGAVPLISAYDPGERVWNPPLPLLFQWSSAGQNRAVSAGTIRKGLGETLTDPDSPPPPEPRSTTSRTTSEGSSSLMPSSPACPRTSPRSSAATRASPPPWATRPPTPPKPSKPTAPSSHAAEPCALARNTAPRPPKNGTPSSDTSNAANSPSESAPARSAHPASMNTPVSAARSCDRTRHSTRGLRRSPTTSKPGSSRLNAKDGSVRLRVCA
ncbi:site-specific integrase [Streptomyces lavendulae]|uniref:site-specific integrase n=1 Tax=Streptomyces lavendulae TaxID=1914 RepID=UPI0036E82DD0